MRTTNWAALFVMATGATAFIACGDDTGTTSTGGGGTGGSTVTTSIGGASTTGVTTGGASSGGASTGGASTGGAGGEGVGGQPMADFTDACPPNMITLVPGQSTTLSGTTSGATDDYQSYCADTSNAPDGLDVVIGVTLTGECTFGVKLDELGNFDGAVSIRKTACGSRVGGDECLNLASAGESQTEALGAGDYFIVVDAANAAAGAGDFELTLNCAKPKCGDGIVNVGEACDGGGVSPDDGCGDPGAANECEAEGAVAAGTCADISGTVDVTNAADVVLPMIPPLFNNAAASDDAQPIDGDCVHEAGGKDQVFAVKALGAGTLSATIEGANGANSCTPPDFLDPTCLDRLVYMRSTCADQSSQISCVNTLDEVPAAAATATVLPNDVVYVFVDGYNGGMFQNGPYAIRFHLAP